MATEKTISARMQMKTDTALNWSKAINFIPKKGEIIIYEADSDYSYERMKIGDGSTKVNDLPFVIGAKDWNQNDPTASDYIKNRPGGFPGTFETIFDGDITLNADGDSYYCVIDPAEFVLESGCKYEVTYDATTYVAECYYESGNDYDSYFLEDEVNLTIVSYTAMKDGSSNVNEISNKNDISHLTVKKIIIPTQKFPEEYIPDVFCRKTIFYTNAIKLNRPYTLYTDRNLTTPATNIELAESYKNGLVYIYDVGHASSTNIIMAISCEIMGEGVGYNNRTFGTLPPLG